MGISMKNFEMPKKLVLEEASYTPTYGKFIAEPFERGYGVTVGNGLRRVLISSIEGTAVTSIRIAGVSHEFSSIPGVVEDVPQIILNIKKLVLKSHFKTPKTITIVVNKKGEVTGKDVKCDETVEVVNPDLHIATEAGPITKPFLKWPALMLKFLISGCLSIYGMPCSVPGLRPAQ